MKPELFQWDISYVGKQRCGCTQVMATTKKAARREFFRLYPAGKLGAVEIMTLQRNRSFARRRNQAARRRE